MKYVTSKTTTILFASVIVVSLLARAQTMAQDRNAQPTVAPSPQTAQPTPAPLPAARPADVASIESIVAAVYDVISGPAGQARDWNRFRSLFVPGARLIPISAVHQNPSSGGNAPPRFMTRVLSVEDFVAGSSRYTQTNGFFEREISRRTERFGNLAHVFSTYESHHAREDTRPFARGINSIQLMNDGSRWWVVTIYWETERPDNPIPSQYLGATQ